MLFFSSKFNFKYVVIIFNILLSILLPAIAHAENAETSALIGVVCNIVNSVKGSGLPVMGVAVLIFGILAIFLRLLLPLIIVLVVCAVLFSGSHKVQEIVSNVANRGTQIINACNKS